MELCCGLQCAKYCDLIVKLLHQLLNLDGWVHPDLNENNSQKRSLTFVKKPLNCTYWYTVSDTVYPMIFTLWAIWTVQPDSCWILLICSPPRPITGDKEMANCVLLVGHTCNSVINVCLNGLHCTLTYLVLIFWYYCDTKFQVHSINVLNISVQIKTLLGLN